MSTPCPSLAEWQTDSTWYPRRRERLLSAVELAGGVSLRRSLTLERAGRIACSISSAATARCLRSHRLRRSHEPRRRSGRDWRDVGTASPPAAETKVYSSHLPRL